MTLQPRTASPWPARSNELKAVQIEKRLLAISPHGTSAAAIRSWATTQIDPLVVGLS